MRPLVFTASLGALLLWGCGDDKPAPAPATPVKKAVAPVAGAPAAGAPASTVTEPKYVYSFSPVGKRDPFRSPVAEVHAGPSSGSSSCSEPLCQWDLDQLNLVAVVTGDANPIAMVEDPQGRGYIIRRNTKVGKQGGKVTNILRDSITVTEFWQGPDGKVNPNPVSLKLKADQATIPNLDLMNNKLVQ